MPRGSRISIAVFGDQARWGDTEHLLAGMFDLLAAGNWQRGGGKGSRPTQIARPGSRQAIGKPIDIEEARRRRAKTLGRPA